jgi:CyaY protein
MLEEKRYRELAADTLRKVLDLFEEVDVDDADAEPSGDVITITYGNGSKCVVNTQSATCQMWLAGAGRGWHFDYDEERGQWLDAKGSGDELFAILRDITNRAAGRSIL